VIISVLYQFVRCLLGCLTVLTRHRVSKDAELLVLRHENAVLRLRVPITLSWPLNWCLVRDKGWSGQVSGCARVYPSGTVGTCVDAIRLSGGAARVRLAGLVPAELVPDRRGALLGYLNSPSEPAVSAEGF
jgi:hypothetical protein